MRKDILSIILQQIRLDGGVHFHCEFGAPWSMSVPRTDAAEFHVVARGTCWLHMPEFDAPIPLQGGDLLVFPHGDAHVLSDAANNLDSNPLGIAVSNLEGYGPIIHGGTGTPAHLLCGYFLFDRERPHALIRSLPKVIHIRGAEGRDLEWLKTTLNFMSLETSLSRPGTEAILNGLVKVLFVQLIRAYAVEAGLATGLLAAMADSKLSKAMEVMYNEPGKRWSLASLAQQAGMSRSAFAQRFRQLVGATVLQFLTELRMQRVCELLINTQSGLADIADQAGYSSEATFGKAFKKVHGIGPGKWRKQALLKYP